MFISAQKDSVEIKQQRAIDNGEKFLMIAWEDNLQWVESELALFYNLYLRQLPLNIIANKLNRPFHEIIYLITYLEAPRNLADKQQLTEHYKTKIKEISDGRQQTSV